MRRAILIGLLCALCGISAGAQSVFLTAAHTRTLSGKTFTGKLCMVPANNNGAVIPFQFGSGGQGTMNEVCYPVSAGALPAGGITVPDTALTNPQNLCLYARMVDPTQPPGKQNVGLYPCLQPASTGQSWCSGGVCNLDNYAPAVTALVVQQTGIPGLPGAQGAPGGLPGATDINTLSGADFGAKLSACIADLSGTYGGICEGRNLGGAALSMASSVTISVPNTIINLPCATITTAAQFIISAGVRNVTIHGCGYQGGSNASGTQGATVLNYTGSATAVQVGDPTYAQDTKGFHLDNLNLVTASGGASAKAIAFYRTQEIDLRDVYMNGDQIGGQTGIYLDGTGNYTGGTFDSDTLNGFGTPLYLTGHLSGSVVGDFANASTFTRLHLNCPTSGGNPIAGTYGVNIVAGDGNTWSGGDIEGCATMMHFGANAVNNTVVGLRNENSNYQFVADSGSSFNGVWTGGTFFTGKLIDNGSRNSFWDAFHHTVNGMKGDWYASQQDNTVTNHYRLGIGTGNLRGLQWESAVDNGTTDNINNWEWGLYDNAAGWFFQDLINNVARLTMGTNGITPGGNNQTALNAAGTGAVILNGSTNAGTGGVVVGSGGPTPATVATIDGAGNATLFGYHRFFANGAEQWRFNCAQSTFCNFDDMNSGSAVHRLRMYTGAGTDLESESTSPVTVNNTSNSGTGGFGVYAGGASYNQLVFRAAPNGASAVYQFPGIASASGSKCLQIDASGYITNTGSACGTGTGNGNGSVTSVGVSVPADESVSGSPVTGSGTIAITRNAQAQNLFLAGPTTGSAAPAYRAIVAGDLPAATPSAQGAVILPTGAGSNTLGTAAMQATSAFDASGAASSAQTAAQSYASNASNLSSGTVAAARLPAATPSAQGAVQLPSGMAGNTLGAAVKAGNTLGCLDGWDHLPCTVYNQTNVSEQAGSGSYATVFTTSAAGIYQVSGYTYSTVCGTSSAGNMTATQYVKATETGITGASGATVSSWQVGSNTTSCSSGVNYTVVYNLASGIAIQTETLLSISSSGTQSAAATWSRAVQVQRIQ